jgi:hypothetical protein
MLGATAAIAPQQPTGTLESQPLNGKLGVICELEVHGIVSESAERLPVPLA